MAALPTFRSTVRSLIVPAALSVTIGIAVIAVIVVFAAREIDRLAEEDSRHLLQSAVTQPRELVKTIAVDYSFWDQAVENLIENFDRDWADANIGVYLRDYGICSTNVFNPENLAIYSIAQCETESDGPFIPFEGGLEHLLNDARKTPRDEVPVAVEGLLWDGNTVHSLAASVLTDYELVDGKSVPEGTDWVLILGTAFNEAKVSEIAKTFRLNNLRIVANENIGSQAHLPIALMDGTQTVSFVWDAPKPGTKLLRRTLPSLLGVLATLVALTVLFLRRATVTARLLEKQTAAMIEEKTRTASYLDVAEVILVAMDPQTNITLINRKGCEVLGYAEDELIGRNWFELVIPADRRDESAASFSKIIAGELEPVRQQENYVLTKSGERRLISWQNSFVRGPEGEITSRLSSGRDITDSRLAEEALQKNRTLLQAVLENSSAEIYVKDIDGRFLLANEKFAADNGLSVGEVVGKTSHDLASKKYAEVFDNQDREVIETKSAITFEFQMPRPDGSLQVYFVTKFPILGEDGEVFGIGGISTEITEHAQAEAAAKQLQEDLAHILRVGTVGEMATGIAQEINQPLTAIKNYAMGMSRRLRSGGAEPEDMTRILEIISDQAQRAGDTIRNLRHLGRREAGEIDEIDINSAIREVASVLTSDAVAKDIQVELELDDDLPAVFGESVQIQQAILNLTRNAIDALAEMPADQAARRLTIRTAPAGDDMIEIMVENTGPEIPDATRSRIFNPFFTTRASGLGMGLSICRTIAEAHGGEIWFASTRDEGTTFHFSLPIENEPRPPKPGTEIPNRR
ncbi:MAG: PAS domain S-box protein [Rhodospirillales bacterium]|nr:PAS domain S-box protein [Rhodospirillales bacterium]